MPCRGSPIRTPTALWIYNLPRLLCFICYRHVTKLHTCHFSYFSLQTTVYSSDNRRQPSDKLHTLLQSISRASAEGAPTMVYDWAGKREICYQMYIQEKKPLEEIMEYMRT